jgi:toxin ParE1/3/4
MSYRLAWRARQDVLQIWQYIAGDNEPAADRFIDLLMRQFSLLGANPHIGRRRDDLREEYRSFPAGQYLVLYRVLNSAGEHPISLQRVEIMHVIHSKRDIDSIFPK